MLNFTFDPRSQRYRYTSGSKAGQFVAAKTVGRLVEDYMVQQRKDVGVITDILLAKKITTNTWQYGIAQALKNLHINAYSLGKGGIGRLTSDDIKAIETRLSSEFRYLKQFAQDVDSGKLSEAQIKNRVTLYIDAAHSSWQQGRLASARDDGFTTERWIAAGDEGTCGDCRGKAALGWQPIGTLGVPGQNVQCLSRCRCNKVYGNEPVSMLDRRDGWLVG